MSVLGKLANALGRNDERPNVELAEALCASGDAAAIAELARVILQAATPVRNDAIKVLYEIGDRRPELIAGHVGAYFETLKSRDNRLVWGGLSAIDTIATLRAGEIVARLDEVIAAADKSLVIAKDKAISILARLAAAGFADTALPLLLGRLAESAANQFPMYAELAVPAVTAPYRGAFQSILEQRLAAIPQPAKRARVEKVLRRLAK